jgi:plastocyanin
MFLAVATACGSSGSSTGPAAGAGAPPAAGHNVTIKNFSFSPSTLTVKAGTKVTFTNEDATPHTATASAGNTFNSGTLGKGQSFTFTFTKPGTYHYICTFHQNMHGTVVVQ